MQNRKPCSWSHWIDRFVIHFFPHSNGFDDAIKSNRIIGPIFSSHCRLQSSCMAIDFLCLCSALPTDNILGLPSFVFISKLGWHQCEHIVEGV